MDEDKCSDNVENIKKQNCELTVENNLLQNVIQDQKQTIKDLQDKLENIAIKGVEKSTIINNTTTIYHNIYLP